MELYEEIAAMRTYIAENGWCKFALKNQGRVCLVGAEMETKEASSRVGDFLTDLALELGYWPADGNDLEYLIDPSGNVISYCKRNVVIYFNNHPDTTENDVLEFLHVAEIRAKELM